MVSRLMTAQVRVHDVDLDGFLALVAREILAQAVREIGEGILHSPVVGNLRDGSVPG